MENQMIQVNPGICGFICRIESRQTDKRTVDISITGSECTMIKTFSDLLPPISLKDLFVPLTRNPIIITADRAGCHPACPVPVAVIKSAETALGLALPKDVSIIFSTPEKNVDHGYE